jgi:hypothetical protein
LLDTSKKLQEACEDLLFLGFEPADNDLQHTGKGEKGLFFPVVCLHVQCANECL